MTSSPDCGRERARKAPACLNCGGPLVGQKLFLTKDIGPGGACTGIFAVSFARRFDSPLHCVPGYAVLARPTMQSVLKANIQLRRVLFGESPAEPAFDEPSQTP